MPTSITLPVLIDRDSPIPLYYQLKEQLALLIRDGTYPPGSQLPPETELQRQLGVSRGTVRQAIQALVGEGRLERSQGQGTFVRKTPPALRLAERFSSIAEDLRQLDVLSSTEILTTNIQPASGRLIDKLQLTRSDDVYYIERLGRVEDEPFLLAFTYLPVKLCPDLFDHNLTERSLYEVLQVVYGLRPARAQRTLEAASADEYESSRLAIAKGAPVQFLHSLVFLQDGRPLEYSRLRFRGDRSRIEFDVEP